MDGDGIFQIARPNSTYYNIIKFNVRTMYTICQMSAYVRKNMADFTYKTRKNWET